MISDAALLEAVAQGVSARQLVAMIIADRDAARAKRAARRAARAPVTVGQVESGLPVQSDSSRTRAAVVPTTAEGRDHPRVKLAMARKAVPLCGLTQNAQEVLAALLDFCNAETLRCHPGIDYIALRLGRTGKDPRRHIRRAIDELCTAGLLRVAAHAGLRHANAYFPQWERLAEVVARFEAGGGVRIGEAQSDSPDNIVPQTQKKIHTSAIPRKVQRGREPDRRQREMMLPVVIDGGGAAVPPQPAAIAREQAGLRVMQALNRHLARFPPRFAERTRADIGAELLEAAVVAEVRERGAGIAVILDGLGPGPPAAATAAG